MSFQNLKRNKDLISKLVNEAEKVGGGEKKNYGDDRVWKPTVDKAGNGYAEFRFLPAPEGEDLPWVRYWDHGFKGPTGQWYIEKSLTSIGNPDPVGELNSTLWNSGHDEDKETARRQKRRLHYVSNIYIVSDPGNPANNGKVFLYQYGKKIFDKIMDVMQPSFQDETPMNPFDFWEGGNFKLKIRQVEGYRNYDKSEFSDKVALMEGNDEKLEAVWQQEYSLKEFLDAKNFKSYEELKARLDKVLGFQGEAAPRTIAEEVMADTIAPAPSDVEVSSALNQVDTAIATAGSDDDLDYFKNMVKKMYQSCNSGLAIMLASDTLQQEDGIITWSAPAILEFALAEFGTATIDHSYSDAIFTLIIYKN